MFELRTRIQWISHTPKTILRDWIFLCLLTLKDHDSRSLTRFLKTTTAKNTTKAVSVSKHHSLFNAFETRVTFEMKPQIKEA